MTEAGNPKNWPIGYTKTETEALKYLLNVKDNGCPVIAVWFQAGALILFFYACFRFHCSNSKEKKYLAEIDISRTKNSKMCDLQKFALDQRGIAVKSLF